jgi:hypothetical protein
MVQFEVRARAVFEQAGQIFVTVQPVSLFDPMHLSAAWGV